MKAKNDIASDDLNDLHDLHDPNAIDIDIGIDIRKIWDAHRFASHSLHAVRSLLSVVSARHAKRSLPDLHRSEMGRRDPCAKFESFVAFHSKTTLYHL
jgi:hypothetical protein